MAALLILDCPVLGLVTQAVNRIELMLNINNFFFINRQPLASFKRLHNETYMMSLKFKDEIYLDGRYFSIIYSFVFQTTRPSISKATLTRLTITTLANQHK